MDRHVLHESVYKQSFLEEDACSSLKPRKTFISWQLQQHYLIATPALSPIVLTQRILKLHPGVIFVFHFWIWCGLTKGTEECKREKKNIKRKIGCKT